MIVTHDRVIVSDVPTARAAVLEEGGREVGDIIELQSRSP
jgi:hypothetical protein